MTTRLRLCIVAALVVATSVGGGAGHAQQAEQADPAPGSPAYVTRDLANIQTAYGRIIGPGGQLDNPAYLPALVAQTTEAEVAQLLLQAATPGRPALSAGNVFPGWNLSLIHI